MKNLHCANCDRYLKFVKPKISYFLEKIVVLSTICSRCKNKDEKMFKVENI